MNKSYTYSAVEPQIIWQPQEGPQVALIECPIFEVFFGGARGGGKTEGSIGDWLHHSSQYGENAVGIFFRRKLKQLEEVIARTKQIFTKLGAKYNEQKKEWRMLNGARLKFAYLERDSDAEEYQGHSYTRVYVEEVTNFPSPSPINKLRATLRSASGVPVGMRLTGNPGGPGHNWVKARYITPDPRGFRVITEECDSWDEFGNPIKVTLDRVFIPSKIGDNRLIMRNDPTYILRLRQSGSEALVKAWLEGNWDIVDGAFFSEWDPSIHVLPTVDWLPKIPRYCNRFRSMDWGSAKPFSVGWYAVSDGTWGLPKGALLKYREWYGAKADNVGLKMDADAVARGILEREKGEVISLSVADPSIFVRDGGPSIAEAMSLAGCQWRKADNKRIAGAERMHIMLKGQMINAIEKGPPLLYFLDCCDDSIRTIPALQHDADNLEDVDTDAEDHSYDETRYAVMSRPLIKYAPTLPILTLLKAPNQYTIRELIKMLEEKAKASEEESYER